MRRPSLDLVVLGLVSGSSAQESSSYHVGIRGGRVLDGTGNPFLHGDVLINGKLAVDAGELTGALAGEVLTPRSSGWPASH